MAAKTKVIPRVKRGVWEQIYLPELVRGLTVTMRHFLINTFAPKDKKEIQTIKYPEEKREFPERFRGLHRLMKREDGSVRCTACMMCATVCPANCIHIEAGERENPGTRDVEKFPKVFEIDELVCVVCGLCVEACPCDALRMDSQVQMSPVNRRAEALQVKEDLMSRGSKSLATDGGVAPEQWRDSFQFLGDADKIYRPDRLYDGKRKK